MLRVSASVAFARAELAPILPAFLAAFPHVRLDLLGRDDRIDLVAEGVDLALRLGPLEDSSLRAKKLGAYERVLVAAPSLLERDGAPESPDDLAGHRCIVFTTTPYGAVWPLERGGERRDIEVQGDVKCSNGELMRDFMVAGLGIAMVPDFLVREQLASGALVRVLPDWAGPPVPLHALWSGRDLPRKARVFLDHWPPPSRQGVSGREAVPERVAAAVREAETRAEVLVGWIQAGGVAVFALAYVLSRPAFADAGGPEPVPFASGAYGCSRPGGCGWPTEAG
jgi:DNA-binding transcriptional LysR family regulator